MGGHPCIEQVGFVSSYVVFLYVIILNKMNVVLMKLINKVD